MPDLRPPGVLSALIGMARWQAGTRGVAAPLEIGRQRMRLDSWTRRSRARATARPPTTTPTATSAPAASDVDPAFELRGFRVPRLIVSPFSAPGTIVRDVYDHTSILKMI